MVKYFHHNKYNRLLLPYIDGELDLILKDAVQNHLTDCKRCREELVQIEISKKVLKAGKTEADLYNTNILWKRITTKIESADTLRSKASEGWSFQRTALKPAVIGFTIVLITALFGLWSGLLKFNPSDERVAINHSGFAFDLGLYLDIKKMPDNKKQLYDTFKAKSVSFKEISEHPTLNTNCYLNLRSTCNVNGTKLLSSNGMHTASGTPQDMARCTPVNGCRSFCPRCDCTALPSIFSYSSSFPTSARIAPAITVSMSMGNPRPRNSCIASADFRAMCTTQRLCSMNVAGQFSIRSVNGISRRSSGVSGLSSSARSQVWVVCSRKSESWIHDNSGHSFSTASRMVHLLPPPGRAD